MKLGIVSDLHTEFWDTHQYQRIGPCIQKQLKDAELILIAGDNGNSNAERSIATINQLFPDQPICIIAGNHDFYGSSYEETIKTLRQTTAKTKNIKFLNQDVYVHNNIRILGCTFWTDYDLFGTQYLSMAKAGMKQSRGARYADFGQITDKNALVTPQTLLDRHRSDKNWLAGELKPFDGLTIVMVHHSPVSFGVHPRYLNDELNPCFSSRLENFFLERKVDIVVWGHTHYSVDVTIDKTRFISNQVGYPVHSSKISETGDFGVVIDV